MSVIEHDKDKPPLKGWTIDRKINIYGTIGLMLAMSGWLWNVQNDVATNTRDIESDREFRDLQISQINSSLVQIAENQRTGHPVSAQLFATIQAQLNRIENKVDRHFETQKHD